MLSGRDLVEAQETASVFLIPPMPEGTALRNFVRNSTASISPNHSNLQGLHIFGQKESLICCFAAALGSGF